MTDLIDTTEMYLKTVFELEEEGIPPMRARIAERLGHSGPTVSQTIARMDRDGLVSLSGDRLIQLTALGRARAMRVVRKHRIAERLLVDVIGLEWEHVHAEACRWEHVMSDRVERKILTLLTDRDVSPYGLPIPGLDELERAEETDASTAAEPPVETGSATQVEAQHLGPGVGPLDRLLAAAEGAELSAVVEQIGEPVQDDAETLTLLHGSGIEPGAAITARRVGDRVEVVAAGVSGADRVSLPRFTATHILVRV